MMSRHFRAESSLHSDRRSNLCEPASGTPFYVTFIEMRDLLEDYAPSWYSDELRHRVESILQGERVQPER